MVEAWRCRDGDRRASPTRIGELSPDVIGRFPPEFPSATPPAAATEEDCCAGPPADPRRNGTGQALPEALRPPRPIGEAGGARPAATAAAPAEIAAGWTARERWLASGVPGRGGAVDLVRVVRAAGLQSQPGEIFFAAWRHQLF